MGKYLAILDALEAKSSCDKSDKSDKSPLFGRLVTLVAHSLSSKPAARTTSRPTAGSRPSRTDVASWPAGGTRPRRSAGPPVTCSASTSHQSGRTRATAGYLDMTRRV
jgi:hypothetical protein